MEWATASPAAPYNFAHIPVVSGIDSFWEQKEKKLSNAHKSSAKVLPYLDIHMPRNTAVGFVIGIFAFIFSFAMVWHIWWLAILGLGSVIVSLLIRSFDYNTDYYITASEVEATENKYQQSILGR